RTSKEKHMTYSRHGQTRRQFLTDTMGAAVGIYGILHIAKPAASAFQQPGAGGVPASVSKLTVAVGMWGRDDLNPGQTLGAAFLPDYFNLIFLMRDENHTIVPALATEWRLTDEGFQLTIHPKARWHDGTPVTAEDIKWSFEAMRGDFSPKFKGHHAATRF